MNYSKIISFCVLSLLLIALSSCEKGVFPWSNSFVGTMSGPMRQTGLTGTFGSFSSIDASGTNTFTFKKIDNKHLTAFANSSDTFIIEASLKKAFTHTADSSISGSVKIINKIDFEIKDKVSDSFHVFFRKQLIFKDVNSGEILSLFDLTTEGKCL